MSKKFTSALRKDLKVRRTGFLGMGRKIEVSGGGLKYTIARKSANAETAALINSKIPIAVLRPPHHA
jgi:hypothetical protein